MTLGSHAISFPGHRHTETIAQAPKYTAIYTCPYRTTTPMSTWEELMVPGMNSYVFYTANKVKLMIYITPVQEKLFPANLFSTWVDE